MDLKQSLIDNNSIKINQSVSSWQEAVKLGTDLLEASGAVTPQYYKRIIELVNEHGPYVIIAPGLAMPHARPEDGVNKTAFALVTLKEPIFFDGEEEPINVLVTLAGSDSDQHLEGLVEVTKIFEDDDSETGVNLDKFLNCTSVDQVLEIITKALN